MSQSEYLVIVVGLILGYWIVSKLLARSSGRKNPSNQSGDHAQYASDPIPPSQAMAWDSVLGILESASVEEIRKAYKVLMSQYHPD